MPKESKGVRMSDDEEKEEKTSSDAKVWRYLNRPDSSAEDREQEEAETQRKKEAEFVKLIEESKNLDVSRLEKLAQINAILADFIDSEEWWNAIREFLEDVCGDKSTTSLTIVLKRVKDDKWVLDAVVK